MLITLGYQLLRAKKVKEAIAIFGLSVETFPKSADAYYGLAEAHRANGDKEPAIKNYQKSLDLDPKNSNATNMLKKLREN